MKSSHYEHALIHVFYMHARTLVCVFAHASLETFHACIDAY